MTRHRTAARVGRFGVRGVLTRWVVGALLLLLAAPLALRSVAGEQRELKFPDNRTMGVIYVRSEVPADRRLEYYGDEWKKVQEARGQVSVPVGVQVRLDVSKSASKDLSGLDGLQPDDLTALNCRDGEVDEKGLGHIGRLTGLKILNLSSTPITDAGFEQLANLKALESIDLDAFGVSRKGFGVGDGALKILAGLPKLESISLRNTKVTDGGMELLATLPELSILRIPGTQVSDAGLMHLKRLPKLTSLSLGVYNEGAKVTDAGLKTVGEMTGLVHLDLSGTKVTDAGLVHLQNLSKLKTLTLEQTKVSEQGLVHLKPLTSLQNLRLYLRGGVTDAGAVHLAEIKSLRRITEFVNVTQKGAALLAALPELKAIELFGDKVDDAAAREMGKAKTLKWLEFQHCSVTDAALEAFSGLENLELFRLFDTRVQGRGLVHLQKLPKLKTLGIKFDDLDELDPPTRPTLKPIAKFEHLENLSLGDGGLTDKDLKGLAGLRGLTSLQLELPVDDAGMLVVSGFDGLTHLTVRHGTFTNEGLSRLLNLRSLTYLWIEGHFTNKGLSKLDTLSSLWGLTVRSPYITDGGVQELEQKLPALQFVQQIKPRDDRDFIHTSKKDPIRRYGSEDERAEKDALEDKDPPALRLAGWLNAGPDGLTLDKLRGKVVLIDFWGTWCGPCRALTPKLKELYRKYRDQGLEIVGVHTTAGAEKMPDYVTEEQIGWPEAADVERATVEAWAIHSYPTVCLIDRAGKLRMAEIYRDDAERAITYLLAEKPAESEGDKE